MAIAARVGKAFSYFYAVPWCMPAWGWGEFRAMIGCILTGRVLKGPCPQRFADAVREHLGVKYALPMNRGRAAIRLALQAMGLGHTDEVILPSYICPTVLEAVVGAGARPVFADVGADLHVTPETVRASMTAQTRCVIVAHLFGNAAPIDEIQRMLDGTGIHLIDDAAQSFGARCSGRLVGTFGTCGIISVGPGKALAGTAGGLLVTDDSRFFERAAAMSLMSLPQERTGDVLRRVLPFWVWRRFRRYTRPLGIFLERIIGPTCEPPCTPSAMSNLDGAIGLCQFRALGTNRSRRQRNANVLLQAVDEMRHWAITDISENGMIVKLVLVTPPQGPTASEIIALLGRAGIECQRGFSPLHLKAEDALALPTTEAVWGRVVCVPVDVTYRGDVSRLSRGFGALTSDRQDSTVMQAEVE